MKTRREASLTTPAQSLRTTTRKRSVVINGKAALAATAADNLVAKHRRAAEMVADIRTKAEALSASADRLLARLS